jgi:hypothetical protein
MFTAATVVLFVFDGGTKEYCSVVTEDSRLKVKVQKIDSDSIDSIIKIKDVYQSSTDAVLCHLDEDGLLTTMID